MEVLLTGVVEATASVAYPRTATVYATQRDQETRPTALGGGLPSPAGAIQRVRDLARWDLIAHMLGWPPLRLVGGG